MCIRDSTVIKDSGNEFAGLVSEGVAAGDITNYVDTGSYIFNAWLVVRFLEVFLPTKLQPWQENQARARLFLLSASFVISLTLILKVASFILRLNPPFPVT